uniref:Kinetochore protein SPC25 n=1 Tax=Anisakis simplex TaxID=6269 RepID=A0A0M3JAF7_ANISI
LILLDKSDETTILRDHSFSSVRLEYVESNFERVRAQVAADKKADVQRERQQLLGEIDEEMKLRRKELEQSQQRITISHETPQRTEESEKAHELEVELDNLQTLSASFCITSNRYKCFITVDNSVQYFQRSLRLTK